MICNYPENIAQIQKVRFVEITQCADFFPGLLTGKAKWSRMQIVRRAPYTEGMLPYQKDSVCGPAVSGENRQHQAAGACFIRDTGSISRRAVKAFCWGTNAFPTTARTKQPVDRTGCFSFCANIGALGCGCIPGCIFVFTDFRQGFGLLPSFQRKKLQKI